MHQLNLNREELKDLVEMVSLALSVAGTETDEHDAHFKAWEQVYAKVLSLASRDPSLGSMFDHSGGHKLPSLTPDYLDKAYFTKKLDDYSEHVFWSDLVIRLADKALEEHLGNEEFERLSEEERRSMTEALEKSLWKECTSYGMDRLGFILPPSDA